MGENIDSRPGGEKSARRTVVLLGAGASADAGLPLTSDLAANIVDKANEVVGNGPVKPDWVRAINAVYAGMVGYQGARGGNPRSAVNIETLISAVRLLGNRDAHEVAPFVASWSPALSDFGSSSLPTRSGKAILDAVGKARGSRVGFNDRDITEAVAAIARAALRPDLKEPLARAEKFILGSLVELLGAHADVSYFAPLLKLARDQAGGLDVITLNYDLTVETAAANEGITVNRGVESWNPGGFLDFPSSDGALNLMKLHGSLDWRTSPSADEPRTSLSPVGIEMFSPERRATAWGSLYPELPWIVVGDREKLATDGPTLVLNFAARLALLRADHLAVAGYSFGDAHINAMIRDWLGGDATRTISILDSHWPREHYYQSRDGFRSALMAEYGSATDGRGQRLLPRVYPVEGSTAERLDTVLDSRLALSPDPIATVAVSRDESAVRFDVTWLGSDLADVRLTVRLIAEPGSTSFNYFSDVPLFEHPPIPDDAVSRNPSGFRRLREQWKSGTTVTVYAPQDTVLPVELEVHGASIAGGAGWKGTVGDSDAR